MSNLHAACLTLKANYLSLSNLSVAIVICRLCVCVCVCVCVCEYVYYSRCHLLCYSVYNQIITFYFIIDYICYNHISLFKLINFGGFKPGKTLTFKLNVATIKINCDLYLKSKKYFSYLQLCIAILIIFRYRTLLTIITKTASGNVSVPELTGSNDDQSKGLI